MRLLQKAGLLLIVALLVSPAAAQAPINQQLATDTLRPAGAKALPLLRIGTTGGQTLYVFHAETKPDASGLYFTYRHPLTLPRPRLVLITTDKIRWLRWGTAYYEPIRLAGTKTGSLAERVVDGPAVELFDYATAKRGVPIPLPVGGVVMTGSLFKKDPYNHDYYLRRPGEPTMTRVPEGKKFAPFLMGYLRPGLPLLDSVRQEANGYRFADLPRLLARCGRAPGR